MLPADNILSWTAEDETEKIVFRVLLFGKGRKSGGIVCEWLGGCSEVEDQENTVVEEGWRSGAKCAKLFPELQAATASPTQTPETDQTEFPTTSSQGK